MKLKEHLQKKEEECGLSYGYSKNYEPDYNAIIDAVKNWARDNKLMDSYDALARETK